MKGLKIAAIIAAAMTLMGGSAAAQAVAPEVVEVHVYANGNLSTPFATRATALMPGSSRCGLDKGVEDPTDPTPLNPTKVLFDDPFAGVTKDCEAPLPLGLPIANGYMAAATYTSTLCAPTVTCRSTLSNFTRSFSVAGGQPDCTNAVFLDVGDWSRSGPARTLGRVLYSLQRSQQPVQRLIVRLSGVEVDNLTGSDLRKVAGSYFMLPIGPGSYSLTVEAQTVEGCSDGATRPMTVVVN